MGRLPPGLRAQRRTGVFRKGLDMIDPHMSISALSVTDSASRRTVSLIFKRDLDALAAATARRGA
ncbi:hypothetical protein [Variovorax saccharolyticus]|uniref:hypothetical protein n=1 Tax=Variovorax saccharolyticus TaxID=3053516 RepID=UPI00336A805C